MKKHLITPCLVLLCTLFIPTTLHAKSVRVRVIDSDLAKLPFGAHEASALRWVDKKIEASFEPLLNAALDRSERAAVTQKMEAKKAQVRTGRVEFKGQKTGLENSVVSGEFVHEADETVIRYRADQTDHYLFFTSGKLWKYVRALKAQGTFAQRLEKQEKDFGSPTQERFEKQLVTEATWEGDRLLVTIRDLRNIYGIDLLLVVNKKMKVVADTKRQDRAGEKNPKIDPELQGILEN